MAAPTAEVKPDPSPNQQAKPDGPNFHGGRGGRGGGRRFSGPGRDNRGPRNSQGGDVSDM